MPQSMRLVPGPLYQAVAAVLLDEHTRSRGLFQAPAVSHFLKEHRSGRADHPATLLTLLYVALWWRTHFEGEPAIPMSVVASDSAARD